MQYSRGRVQVGVPLWFLWVEPMSARSANNWDFLGGPVARTPSSQCRDPGSIPVWGTRSHMLQLRAHMSQLKIPHAIAEKKKNPHAAVKIEDPVYGN